MAEKPSIDQVERPPAETELDRTGIERLSEEERKAWLLLVEKHRKSAIKPSDFADLYDVRNIEEDERYVSRMERTFKAQNDPAEAENQRRGELLEALLAEGIKSARWMGPDTTSITPSRYDDIHNGVDLILELLGREGFSYLSLNIDMTSSPEGASKKIIAIKDKILNGKLSSVKYLHSKRTHIRGEFEMIPKVVIGIDSKHLRKLCLARIEAYTFKRGLKHPDNQSPSTQSSLKEKLGASIEKIIKSISRIIIIKEIEMQLIKFEDFARKNNIDEIADKYMAARETLERIKGTEEKLLDTESGEEIQDDQVFKSIELGLKNL